MKWIFGDHRYRTPEGKNLYNVPMFKLTWETIS